MGQILALPPARSRAGWYPGPGSAGILPGGSRPRPKGQRRTGACRLGVASRSGWQGLPGRPAVQSPASSSATIGSPQAGQVSPHWATFRSIPQLWQIRWSGEGRSSGMGRLFGWDGRRVRVSPRHRISASRRCNASRIASAHRISGRNPYPIPSASASDNGDSSPRGARLAPRRPPKARGRQVRRLPRPPRTR